jgi:hypothetical protein
VKVGGEQVTAAERNHAELGLAAGLHHAVQALVEGAVAAAGDHQIAAGLDGQASLLHGATAMRGCTGLNLHSCLAKHFRDERDLLGPLARPLSGCRVVDEEEFAHDPAEFKSSEYRLRQEPDLAAN